MKIVNQKRKIFLLIFLLLSSISYSQIREYKIHKRGMLHETVFNTGEIGRGWATGEAGNETDVPLFEWPPYSHTFVEGIEYSGQHNLLGAGVYIAANIEGSLGIDNRLYAMCGAVGASLPEVVFGRWSYPLFMEKIENFPILADGSLNPAYDPNEAEEIIKTSWGTPVGITVTRTSRAWSYPDYDDLIIYEYEFEYTGDTNGDPETIELDKTLKDVMIAFNYGFAPSMYGYQRHYNVWKYEGGIYRGDQRNFWDSDYWLTFNMDVQVNLDPSLAGKPEPNKELFKLFASTGKNGGGYCSPQAPGYCMLYYDTTYLARVDPYDPNLNESEAVTILRTYQGKYFELDDNYNILQPWSNKVSTGNTNSDKMKRESINPDKRWSGVYSEGSTTWPVVPNYRWYGRAAYNYRQSNDAGQKHIVFGPYTLRPGNKLRYALAEVVGYGGQPGKSIEGGQVTTQWSTIPDWNKPIVIGGETMTNAYLDEFGYPDYVNSDIRNVTQVAHKAFQTYLGQDSIVVPVWPESNPSTGSYKIPTPFPAPAIEIVSTALAEIEITWKNAAESFTHPRLSDASLSKYNVYRSESGMGPWQLLASVSAGTDQNGNYTFLDTDSTFRVGEKRYYCVTSVGSNGNESGKTNLQQFQKKIGSVEKLGKVYVVPNPFVSKSGFTGSGPAEDQIGFYGLPPECTIRIFSYSGQLVETLEHNDNSYSTEWFQITQNGQEVASGVYFYVVTTPLGEKSTGKFIIIR